MAKVKDTVVRIMEKQGGRYIVAGWATEDAGLEPYPLPRKFSFTEASIEGLPFNAGEQRIHWDVELPCFGLLVSFDSKTFVIQKNVNGQPKRRTVGSWRQYSLKDARAKAKKMMYLMDEGIDPLQAERAAIRERAGIPTLQVAYDEYAAREDPDTGKPKLKPGTLKDYDNYMKRCFAEWAKRPVTEISIDDIRVRHKRIKSMAKRENQTGQAYADNAMRLLSAVLNHVAAERENAKGEPLVRENIVRRALKGRTGATKARKNFIIDANLPTWFKCLYDLRTGENSKRLAVGADYLTFVVYTGLRRSEAARLRWEDVDMKNRSAIIRDTKNGKPLPVALTGPILSILGRREEATGGVGWVFPSPGKKGTGKHLAEPRYVIDLVKEKTGIVHTVHDLRRTFNQVGKDAGVPKEIRKLLLNHSTDKNDVTDEHYTTYTADDLRAPMDRISDRLFGFEMKAQPMKLATATTA